MSGNETPKYCGAFAEQRLTGELAEMFAKSRHLEGEIRQRLGAMGYEF